ncbi:MULTISPECIES: hypothetical protein [Bacillaceae]|uniref:Uncharacterized protein n=1 Tax=Evansella alkalicola TaxID=745819 RepID=A0ABS6JPQ8_9BACI|nr:MULTISPECIES: hypothetical protein [Bacillaceae]MBU9720553.1 hypothetical protein [Bacillus alkalicola]
MILVGDTIRLKCHFKSLNGQAVEPENIVLTFYDEKVGQIEEINLDTDNREHVGVYFYDYVVPENEKVIIFEFKGTHNDKPIITRGKIEPKFV